MIFVDSSVWIDYFNGVESKETDFLNEAFSTDSICLGDIVLAEVLQGFRSDRDFTAARNLLVALPIYQVMTLELAITGAENYRRLRKRGVTVRKSVDVWIATFCIENSLPLLFSDRDYRPFVKHLKLKSPLQYT